MFGKKKKIKVLIVEDSKLMSNLIKDGLESRNYDVITAENGKEGVGKAIAEKSDIILLDVMMPEMDGIEACQKIRQNEMMHDIPIIATTGLGLTMDPEKKENEKRIYGAGFEAMFTKPFSCAELIKCIEKLIEQKKIMAKQKNHNV